MEFWHASSCSRATIIAHNQDFVNRQNTQKTHLFFYLQFSKIFGIIYLESEREIKRERSPQSVRFEVRTSPQ